MEDFVPGRILRLFHSPKRKSLDGPQLPAQSRGAHSPPRAREISAAAASHPVFAATWERVGLASVTGGATSGPFRPP